MGRMGIAPHSHNARLTHPVQQHLGHQVGRVHRVGQTVKQQSRAVIPDHNRRTAAPPGVGAVPDLLHRARDAGVQRHAILISGLCNGLAYQHPLPDLHRGDGGHTAGAQLQGDEHPLRRCVRPHQGFSSCISFSGCGMDPAQCHSSHRVPPAGRQSRRAPAPGSSSPVNSLNNRKLSYIMPRLKSSPAKENLQFSAVFPCINAPFSA